MRRKRWGAIGAAGALVGITALVSVAPGSPASAEPGDGTITITVIRDVNANSNYDPLLEVGVAGIPVTVTDDAGNVWTLETGADGEVEFDMSLSTLTGGRYRVEAAIPDTMPYLQPAQVAGGNLSPLTDFVDVSGNTDVALTMGVINPADYVGPTPDLVSAFQWPSDPPPVGLTTDPRSLISFSYADRGETPEPTTIADQVETRTLYGLAYQRTTGNIFSGAYAKRFTIYGPGAQGGIYRTSGVSGETTLWGMVPNAGTIAHGASFDSPEELAFWDVVGKQALGDLELSEDGTRLYAVNLNDRSIYEYDATLEAMGDPLSITPIPNTSCEVAADWRPFGLGVRDGKLYAGGVCSAESTGLREDLRAAVWTFDVGGAGTPPHAPTAPQETFVQSDMTYLRGAVITGSGPLATHWNAWLPTYNATTAADPTVFDGATGAAAQVLRRPMPMLTDIAIEADGSLVLGFRDRLGDQLGVAEPSPRGAGTTDNVMVGGDLNRVCRFDDGTDEGTYVWEGDTDGPNTCPNNHVVPNGGPTQHPDVVEYYPGDFYREDGAHQETAEGAIALALSEGRVAVTTLDPAFNNSAGGVGFYDRTDGDMWASDPDGAGPLPPPNGFELYADGRGSSPTSIEYSFGKGNGLADLEVIAALAPIEIGNYVWFDADRDGVQDPGEDPIGDVTVQLFDAAGAMIGETVTDPNGNYYFGGTTGNGMIGDNELSAFSTYYIRIPDAIGGAQQTALTGFVPTEQDSGLASDTTDSDGGLVGVHDEITITTGDWGFNNHTYDFGFYLPVYDLALRKTLAAGQASVVNPGDLVTFAITVFNQGLNTASNITVTDYIPAGMTLEDADWTAGAGNTATTVLPGTLAAGASTTVDISLRLSSEPFEGALDNHAEISSFTDEWGGSREDEDSTPDDEFGNDELVDDEVDNGGGDEDDQDIASISVTTPPPPTTTTTTVPPTSPPQPPPPPTTAMPNPGELPATGGNSGMLATLAVLLVIGGAGVAMLARIRRRPAR